MVRLASGVVDIPRVISTARAVGVSHFIIEDESPGSAAQIPVSVQAVLPLIFDGAQKARQQ
jgi:hypothetical protein